MVAGAVAVEGVGDRRAAVAVAAARAPPPLAPPARAGAAWRAASAAAAPLLAPALEQPPPGEPVEANCADRVGHLGWGEGHPELTVAAAAAVAGWRSEPCEQG